MKIFFIFTLLSCVSTILCTEMSPKIIIIGAGPAGIAAASMLFATGFKNVTILEAENRIGGRVYSVEIGQYLVDLGGQWIDGDKNNVAFELAWPLGLLKKSDVGNLGQKTKLFASSGKEIPLDSVADMINYYFECSKHIPNDLKDLKTGSYGEYMENRLNEYFQNHSEINSDQKIAILNFLNLSEMSLYAAPDWSQVSAKRLRILAFNKGDYLFNWKNRTYATILDILMRKFPNPEEELPVMNNTMLNSKVKKIHYDMSDGSKKVVTEDDKEYLVDHIIFTASLGVLKVEYEKLFDPPLPESKITAIKSIGMGGVGKIYLYYDNPWWIDNFYLKGLFWTENDKNELLNSSSKKWMLGVHKVIPIEDKAKLLCLWISGPYVRDMEMVPEDVLRNHISELLHRFFDHAYNVTEPRLIKRSLWMTNDNFRGTNSYPSLESEKFNSYPATLAEPIIKNDKPILQFAGEATADIYGTVHGAISSGQREASRLIGFYSKQINL